MQGGSEEAMYKVLVATTVQTTDETIHLGYDFKCRGPEEEDSALKLFYLYDIGLFEGHYRLKLTNASSDDGFKVDVVAAFSAFQTVLRDMHGVESPCMKIVRICKCNEEKDIKGSAVVVRLHNDPPPINFGMMHCKLCLDVAPENDHKKSFYCSACAAT